MIKAVYADDYVVPTRTHNFEKLEFVARAVKQRKLAEVVDPGYIPLDLISTLHDPEYVQGFLDGRAPFATTQNLPWSPQLRSSVLGMQAGQLKAAQIALEEGLSGHIANGFHHAGYSRGRGFCTFNGLALVAHALRGTRVFALDCDQHGGNGTEEFTHYLENLFNYSICGNAFGCKGGPRSVIRDGTKEYSHELQRAFEQASAWRPDLIIYQAGADCHVEDPVGKGMLTTKDLVSRDISVFRFCRDARIPVMFTMAGGYQSFDRSTELHVNTFIAANLSIEEKITGELLECCAGSN